MDYESNYEVDPIKPSDFVNTYRGIAGSAIEAGTAEPPLTEVELRPSTFANFRQQLALAKQHHAANEPELAWHYLLQAQQTVSYHEGYRAGYFQCNKAHEGKDIPDEGHEQLVALFLESYPNRQWADVEGLVDALKEAGRQVGYGVGPIRREELLADARLKPLVKRIKSGG